MKPTREVDEKNKSKGNAYGLVDEVHLKNDETLKFLLNEHEGTVVGKKHQFFLVRFDNFETNRDFELL